MKERTCITMLNDYYFITLQVNFMNSITLSHDKKGIIKSAVK